MVTHGVKAGMAACVRVGCELFLGVQRSTVNTTNIMQESGAYADHPSTRFSPERSLVCPAR